MRPKNNSGRRFIRLIYLALLLPIMLLSTVAGCIIGDEIFYNTDQGYDHTIPEAHWRKLPDPPDQLDRLVDALPYNVFVETTDGKLLSCVTLPFNENCWQEISRIQKFSKFLQPCSYYYDQDLGISIPSNENVHIVELIESDICNYVGREMERSHFAFALDENNQIWFWGYDQHDLWRKTELNQVYFKYQSAGIWVGLLLPLVMGIWLWRGTRMREGEEDAF